MAKKRQVREPIEPIQYRPGGKLGELINDFAGIWQTSRGEAAKRLTALAAHKLDLEFAPLVQELAGYLHGTEDFVDACHMVYVWLQECATISHVEQLEIVRQKIELYRMIHGIQTEVEKNRLVVKLYRTR